MPHIKSGGVSGIRTHGAFTLIYLVDKRHKPLGHHTIYNYFFQSGGRYRTRTYGAITPYGLAIRCLTNSANLPIWGDISDSNRHLLWSQQSALPLS